MFAGVANAVGLVTSYAHATQQTLLSIATVLASSTPADDSERARRRRTTASHPECSVASQSWESA
ncbi:MAG: hypothetical protein ABI611_23330 [Solirubrobacteraceae bacterium]